MIVLPSFTRQKLKLQTKCCVVKVRQYICIILKGQTHLCHTRKIWKTRVYLLGMGHSWIK